MGCCGSGSGRKYSGEFYSESPSYNSLDDLTLEMMEECEDEELPEVLSPRDAPNPLEPPADGDEFPQMPLGANPMQQNTNLALPATAALRQADFQQSHSRSRSVSFGSRSMSLQAMRDIGLSPGQMNQQSSNLTNLTSSSASGLGEPPFGGNGFRPPTLNLHPSASVPQNPTSAVQNLSAFPSASPAPNKRKKKKDRKSVSFKLGSNNSNASPTRTSLANQQLTKKDSGKKKRKHTKTKSNVDTDKKVSDWSESECSAWVKSLGAAYSKYAQIFTDNGVDGSLLIEMFDSDFQSLGIDHKFHIKKLQKSLEKKLTSEEKQIRKNGSSSRSSKSKSKSISKSVSKSKSRPRPDIPSPIRKPANDSGNRLQRGMAPQASASTARDMKGYNTRLERNKMVGTQMQQMPVKTQRKVKKKKRKRSKQPATATYGTLNMNAMNAATNMNAMNAATSMNAMNAATNMNAMNPAASMNTMASSGYQAVMPASAYNQSSQQQRFVTATQTAAIRSSKTKHMYKKRKSKPKRSKSRGAVQMNQHMNTQYMAPQIAAQGMNAQYQTMPQSQFNQGSIQTTIQATAMSPKFMKSTTNQSNSSQPAFKTNYQTQNFQAMDPRWQGVYE